MLVKMALSKLVINTVDRINLFFNKFAYRVIVHSVPSINWVHKCANIQDYIEYIDDKYRVWEETNQQYPNSWYRIPNKSTDLDLLRIENLINLIHIYNDKSVVQYRSEYQSLSVYTSDLKIAKIFANKLSVGMITQVSPMPTGVMLFKREPPAKYRAYTTNNKMPEDFKENFVAYLERTPDIRPSVSLKHYFVRRNTCLWDNYFVDYDDEKNLMMMMLMFPGMIGKKYKLEQK
jgi:hypothetical protein